MTDLTDCQGLSLGRIAVARPWIFAQWTRDFEPGPDIYMTTALRMVSLLGRHYDDYFTVKFFKKFAPYFCANFKFSQSILKQLMPAQTPEDLKDRIKALMNPQPELLTIPNINLFI